jgi:PAS domain S-box-containing protein
VNTVDPSIVEAALREAEERTRLLLDSASDYAILTLDDDGLITSWNVGAEALFGWSAAEAVGRHFGLLFTPEDQDAGIPAGEIARATDAGRAEEEGWRVRRDGGRFWGAGHLLPLRQGHGFLKILRDTTEQRRAQELLELSEARFRSLADTMPQLAWMADEQGEILWFNRRWVEFTGLDPNADRDGRLALVHPDYREAVSKEFLETLRAGQPWEATFPMRGADGEYRWFLSRAAPIREWVEGLPARWFGTNTDITEQRRVEAALRASEARARTLHETLPQLVWTCLPNGMCEYLSPQWVAYTGVPEAEQLGFGWLDQVHPDDRERVYQHWMGAVAGRHPYDIDFRVRRHDGEWRWFKVRGAAIRDETGAIEHWFGACTDIQDIVEARETLARSREALEAKVEARTSELRQANAMLLAEVADRQQAEEALHQAQKMEAIGQLTGGVAHDFNNLLTAITGNLELLQRRIAAGDHEVGRYVEGAMASARRAASLTQRLLAFSRRQALTPKATDLGRLAAEMEELIRRSLGEDIVVELAADEGLWRTWCDPNQVENALLNLTINARDAMPDGGTLTIEARNVTVGPEGAHDLAAGDYVMLAVGDTGIGMTPEVMARAFDPFFTTKPIGQGTGLGLSQLYGFARQSGGQAVIESEPGEGSRVKLYLPRYRGRAQAEEPVVPVAVARAAAGTARTETVLVVEDEELVRMLVVQTLEEAGYRVVETRDAPEALAQLEELDRLDLLVTDVGLPVINGRQLAEMVRQQRPGVPVLFMTGYAHNAAVGGEDLEPGMSLIEKPFAIDALAARVDAILN